MIDGIAPFFAGRPRCKTNWSKAPFEYLDPLRPGADGVWDRVLGAVDVFAGRAAAMGYNAITLDDVAHLARSPLYEPEVQELIAAYRERFREVFRILDRHRLSIYLTMDVLSYTPSLLDRVGTSVGAVARFMEDALSGLFREEKTIRGVVMRVGESDGLDVRHRFRSRLVLRRPSQINDLLHRVLPCFETHDRELVFRTWTVGAYRAGDLIWHRRRILEAFRGLDSPALTVSMKYGESDFFRYLPVNSHFFRLRLPKLVELQARREYEGSGEFPSFIGGDYAAYARQLREAPNMRGISVWCQTGGWTPFARLSLLDRDAVWNDVNTAVTLRVFRDGAEPAQAVREWARDCGVADGDALAELLEMSESLVKRLLYIPDFAEQKLFFRRVRVPTLLNVYWNNIFINHSLRKVFRHFVGDGEECVLEGERLLGTFDRMERLAEQAGVPAGDIAFMRDTFRILVLARAYYFRPFNGDIRERIKAAKRAYKKSYPKSLRPRYRIKTNFEPFHLDRRTLGWLSWLALRRQRGYRMVDRILTLNVLSLVYWLVRSQKPKMFPKFARKSAMGIDTVFR